MKNGRIYSMQSEKTFILVITLIFLFLTFFILLDILSVIVYSFLISYFLYPVYKFFLKKVKDERISSILALVTFTGVFFVPFALFLYFVILNLIKILLQYRIYLENPDILDSMIKTFVERFTGSSALSTVDLSEIFSSFVIYVIDFIREFFSSMPQTIFYFFIVMFLSYYILIYNKNLFKAANDYVPLSLRKQNEIIRNININLKVLFRGYFLTGLIQTGIALIGYIIFGVPNILILTVFTFILSLIPYLGPPLIWVPASIYLILSGNEVGGIGLLIYGTFIISTIDNFVRPLLMSDKDTISPPLVFVGFVGGLLAFGISGIILGPLIIAITTILLKYLKENFEMKE